jgi:broad specificity phosphatase PhoE
MLALLVRHTEHELGPGVLAGRRDGVRLSRTGEEQARDLARRIAEGPAGRRVRAIYASPMLRTRQTAAALAERLGLEVRDLPSFIEVEFGEWTGSRFDALAQHAQWGPQWKRWNTVRSQTRPPGGEMMLEVQARVADALETLRAEHKDDAIVIVSHGDVIRAAVAHCLGVPLDLFLRIEIGLGSVSVVRIGEGPPQVLRVNLYSLESEIE